MKQELLLQFQFEASHSLSGYETPHPHLWKIKVAIEGKPIQGRIIDLVVLRNRIQQLMDSLDQTDLNDCNGVSAQVNEFPTCETLAPFFYDKIQEILEKNFLPFSPSVRLTCVEVGLCDLLGVELGAIRLTI